MFFLLLLITGVVFNLTSFVSKPQVIGQTAADLQQQKDAKQKQLMAILNKINAYQSEIRLAQGQANTLKNQINILRRRSRRTLFFGMRPRPFFSEKKGIGNEGTS